jgi:Tfp pilus assembly protein PilX
MRVERHRRCKNGYALLTVVFIIVSFAVLGISSVALVTGSAQMMSDEYHTQQAFNLADAGLNVVAEQLSGDSDWSDNMGFSRVFGPGNFTVTYVAQTTTSATVQVEGTVEGISRTVQRSFTAGGTNAFDHSMYTKGDIDVTGSSVGAVDGSVSAGGVIDDDGGVTFNGDMEENADNEVPIPDWDYWQTSADHVYTGNYNFLSGSYSGVYFIAGNVQINHNVTLNGSIISTGSVTTAGSSNITITALPGLPAIVAKGSVSFTGSSNLSIYGWVISLANVTFTGNSDVATVGGVVAEGDIVATGNTDIDIDYGESYIPTTGFVGGGGAGLQFGTWREIY